MGKRYYLAYGSNLNIPQMRLRCPGARKVGTAEIAGYRLLFKGSRTGSYLTIEPADGAVVPVGVWEVTTEDEEALDRYEGYPAFYYKKEITLPVKLLRTGETENLDTFVYIMHEDRPFGLPGWEYIRTCLAGYRSFGFSKQLIWDAVEDTKKEMGL